MVRTRRSALRLSGLVVMGGLGGCSTDGTEASPTDRTSSDTPSRPTPSEEVPSFTGEILRQASEESPARVSAIVRNDGKSTVEVGYGPALLFTDNAGGRYEWPQAIVLDPDAYVGPWDDPYQSADGCWRFPEDGRTLVQSILEWRTLDPGESVNEEYSIYTRGDSRSCLPAGTYRFQDGGHLDREDQSVMFSLTARVGDDGQLTAISGRLRSDPS